MIDKTDLEIIGNCFNRVKSNERLKEINYDKPKDEDDYIY